MARRSRSEAVVSGGYAKVSATLDRDVLRMIREKTSNVSGFLNEAAKDKLYFQMLRDTVAELDREGVGRDEKFEAALRARLLASERRRARRAKRLASR